MSKENTYQTAVMVHPNKPYEPAWMLMHFDTVEEARIYAWKQAQKRDPSDPERYSVNGIKY